MFPLLYQLLCILSRTFRSSLPAVCMLLHLSMCLALHHLIPLSLPVILTAPLRLQLRLNQYRLLNPVRQNLHQMSVLMRLHLLLLRNYLLSVHHLHCLLLHPQLPLLCFRHYSKWCTQSFHHLQSLRQV